MALPLKNKVAIALWAWRIGVMLFAVVGIVVLLVSTFIVNYNMANPLNSCATGYWTAAMAFSVVNVLLIGLYVATAAWTLVDPKPIVDFVLRYIVPVVSLVVADTAVLTAKKATENNQESEHLELRSDDDFPPPPSEDAWNSKVHRVAQYTQIIVSVVLVVICILVLVINLLAIAGAIGFSIFKNQHATPISGTFTFPGLNGPVQVLRDQRDVVHIIAEDRHDAAFAQAVVHSQERLFQMEFYRRLGSGRLSEVVGEDGLDYDRLMVTLGLYGSVSTIYDNLESDSKGMLDAYVEGVNAWLATDPRLPIEFGLLNISKMDPWTIEDSLVYSKIMSLDLSGNMNDELLRYEMLVDKGIPPERIEQLFRSYPTDANPTILSEVDLDNSALPKKTLEDEEDEAASRQAELDRLRSVYQDALHSVAKTLLRNAESTSTSSWASKLNDPYNFGFLSEQRRPPSQSNNWVINGSFTASGKPILADDPHLRFSAPMIWFLMHIRTTEDPVYNINVTGATIPSIPGVIIGRTDKFAWGVTNSGIDVQDVFVLQEDANHTQYFHNGEWKNYTLKTTTIKVKDGKDVQLRIRQCVYGPVISDGLDDMPGDKPLALRWTSLDVNDTLFDSYMRINRAQDWTSFKNAMTRYTAPIQNFIYADTSGHIGYIAVGKVPKRAANHTGKYPAPGTGEFDWVDYVPIDELPWVFDPAAGYIVTANGKITPDSYLHNLGFDFADGYRHRRIAELIQSTPNITVANVKAMQQDQTLALWDDVKIVFQRMNDTGAKNRLSANANNWLMKLLKWDGNMHRSAESQEATLFETWYQLMTELPSEETGYDNWDDSTFILTLLNATGYQNQEVYDVQDEDPSLDPVCNITKKNQTYSCPLTAESVFENAVSKWGRNMPIWGTDVHRVFFSNVVIGSSPVLGCLGNREVSFGGNSRTVNPAAVKGLNLEDDEEDGLRAQSGASYRQIIDLSSMENSQFVIPMGPSENVLDRFRFDSWLKDWTDGGYLPMKMVTTTISAEMKFEKS